MPRGIYDATRAMVVESRALEVTNRNLAMSSVPGYRRESSYRMPFNEILEAQKRNEEFAEEGGIGQLPAGSYYTFDDGMIEPTEAPYDMALSGDGFFVVQDGAGHNLLTRNGHFTVDEQNRLVTGAGYLVQGQGGPIVIPPEASKVVVDEGGGIAVVREEGGVTTTNQVDQLRIATVIEPRTMASINGVYFNPGKQALRDSVATVHQGKLERANTNSVQDLIELVGIQRRFEFAQKTLTEMSNTGGGYSDILRG